MKRGFTTESTEDTERRRGEKKKAKEREKGRGRRGAFLLLSPSFLFCLLCALCALCGESSSF
jgi:hypothetical protein